MKFLRIADVGHDEAVAEAARALRAGGIVLYPTDTLYGLGVDALNEEAIERLRQLKGRERKKPVSILVADVDAVAEHGDLHSEAHALAQRHMPGALTLVVEAKPHIPESLTLNNAIGIRVPNDSFALALARAFGGPFTATSANLAGHQTLATPMDIVVALGPSTNMVDLVIDDGPRDGEYPSTVVLYTGEQPLILRPGKLSREELGIE